MRIWLVGRRDSPGSRKRRENVFFASFFFLCMTAFCIDDVWGRDFSNGIFDLCSTGQERSSYADGFDSDVLSNERDVQGVGILELAGLKGSDSTDLWEIQESSETNSREPSGLFASYASQGTSDATFSGNNCSFSQDVIIRGSVLNFPSLTSLQFWGNGYVGYGHVTPKHESRVGEDLSGAAFGLNVPLGVATLSAYYDYHRNRAQYDSKTIRQHCDAFGASLYLNVGDFYAVASGLYGDDGYIGRTTTKVVPAATEESLLEEGTESAEPTSVLKTSRVKGCQQTWYFETGYEMATLGLFSLQPFAAYEYANLKHGGFDVNTLDTTGVTRKYNSCLATLGSRVNVNLAGMDVFALQGRMAWLTQLRKKNEAFHNFSYGRVPGTISPSQPYFLGKDAGSDYFWGGIGTRLSFKGMIAVSADYDCLINKYQTLNVGSLGLLNGF